MAPAEPSSSNDPGRDLADAPAHDLVGGVVWLRGEHDLSTVPELSAALTEVITLDDSDVVVDLTDVQFVDAATVVVFLRARELLRARSRGLVLRSPPRCVRRVLELCDHDDLLTPARAGPGTGTTDAPGTFEPSPTTHRSNHPTGTTPPALQRRRDHPDMAPTPHCRRSSSATAMSSWLHLSPVAGTP